MRDVNIIKNIISKIVKDYVNMKKIEGNRSIFKLTSNLRTRTYNAFKAQSVSKNNKTMDILGCFIRSSNTGSNFNSLVI